MKVKRRKLLFFGFISTIVASLSILPFVLNTQYSNIKQDKIFNSRLAASNIETIELSSNEYKKEISTEGIIKIANIENKTFSLHTTSDTSKNFWSMSFNKLSESPYGFRPQIGNVRDQFFLEASNFSLDQLTTSLLTDNRDENVNYINYGLYDSNANEKTDFLNPSIWIGYGHSEGSYGFTNGPTSSENIFKDNQTTLHNSNVALLVSSKFEKASNLVATNNGTDASSGINRLSNNGWFSSGYFVFENGSISYCIPQKTQDASDFTLNTSAVTDELKKVTAKNFIDANRKNLANLLTLNIKNSLPTINIDGKLTADIDNRQGKISFKYTPSKIVSVTNVNGGFFQNGLVDNSNSEGFLVGEITGFYTNTDLVDGIGKEVQKSIGTIGSRYSAADIPESELKKRVTQLKNELWTECPDLAEDGDDIGVVGEISRDLATNTVKIKVYPKFIFRDGVRTSNDSYEFQTTIHFIDFNTFEVTLIKKRDEYEADKNIYIPSELNYFFNNTSNNGTLKDKLLIYCYITGAQTDISGVEIQSINVTDPNDQNGTAKLTIVANNCRLQDQSKGQQIFEVELDNLKTIKDTDLDWKIVDKNQNPFSADYTFNYQDVFTIEKFIYELKNNNQYGSEFYKWLKNIIVNEPIDSTLSVEIKENNGIWYSNKDKYIDITLKLDKYYFGGTKKEDDQFEVDLRINVKNATVPNAPTNLSGESLWEYNDKFANDITDEQIKNYIWKKLSPTVTSEVTLDNILYFPRNENGSVLSIDNNLLYSIQRDNKNGTITIKYHLNTYYDEQNLNTVRITDNIDSVENPSSETLDTKKPNVTEYDNQVKEIHIVGFETIDAKTFNDENNSTIISTIQRELNLSGNVDGVSISYSIASPQDTNDIYNGKLKINITIKNAYVYDENNNNGNYTKQENINISEIYLLGFKKYQQTDLIKQEISIKDLVVDNDTTANNVDWTNSKIVDLIFQNKEKFFSSLPDGFNKDNIRIDKIQYNAFDGSDVAIDNPTITFDIYLNKYIKLDQSGDLSEALEEKLFGKITLSGFRKSIATNISINTNVGDISVLAQQMTNDNIKQHIDINELLTINSTFPQNFNLENNLVINVGNWNNSNGTLDVQITVNNVYVDDKNTNKQFPIGSWGPNTYTLEGFKTVNEPTDLKDAVKNSGITINAENFYASQISINDLKALLVANKDTLFTSIDNTFNVENIEVLEENLERIDIDSSTNGQGVIIIKNMTINNYYGDDQKRTWYAPSPASNYQGQKFFQNIIVKGFKQKLPTKINEEYKTNGITVEGITDYVSQQTQGTSQSQNIINIINQYIYDKREEIFANMLTIDKQDLIVEYVDNSWNNKDSSILVNIKLAKYIDDKGQDVTNGKTLDFENIKIKGFKSISNTLIHTEIHSNLTTYPNTTSIDDIKNYIFQNQSDVFNNVPIEFIGNNGYTISDIIVKSLDSNSATEGWIKISISITKYYKNDDRFSYIESTSEQDYLTQECRFYVNKYTPTTIPNDITNITIDSNINFGNVSISEVLAQDFTSSQDKSPVTNNIKEKIVQLFANQINGITVDDIEIKYTNEFNNLNGTVVIGSITIKNSKWIDPDNGIMTEKVITASDLGGKSILIKGFKNISNTVVTKTSFVATKMIDFDLSTFSSLYVQEIVENKINDLISNFQTWLLSNSTNWVNNLHIVSGSNQQMFNKFDYKDYSNKKGIISFDYEINKSFVYSGEYGAYGQNSLSGTFTIEIGEKITGISKINSTVKIKDSQLWGVLPSDFQNKNKDEASNIIKELIINQIIQERNTNKNEFLTNNSLFSNLPRAWLDYSEDQLSQIIDIKFKSSNDGDGSMTFDISINGCSFFVEKNNDYFLDKTYSTSSSNINSIPQFKVYGFKTNDPFPIIPVALAVSAVVILIIIGCLLAYYYHKKKKYKTITVANKKDL